ncbi:hypothetical protein C6P40_001995 [Pichia californica]|uniref:Uncharacterized protein n=1 Tax=Pichia californica TaxID=460514 RepID=A0A9P7BEA9_9ASCO|nr:hypothetical protein C6P42_004135 [[Candida] californica]KAG0687691.1 hypothetical protein C6P40_001995 [[Candida] californica]
MGLFNLKSSSKKKNVELPPIIASPPKVPNYLKPFQFPLELENCFINYKSNNDSRNQTLTFNILYNLENFEKNYEKNLKQFMLKFKFETLKKYKPKLFEIYGSSIENFKFITSDIKFINDIAPIFKISEKLISSNNIKGIIKMQIQLNKSLNEIESNFKKDYRLILAMEGIKSGLFFFEEPKLNLKLFYFQLNQTIDTIQFFNNLNDSLKLCGDIIITRNSLNNYGFQPQIQHSNNILHQNHSNINSIDENVPTTMIVLINNNSGTLPLYNVNLLTIDSKNFETAPLTNVETPNADRFFFKLQ